MLIWDRSDCGQAGVPNGPLIGLHHGHPGVWKMALPPSQHQQSGRARLAISSVINSSGGWAGPPRSAVRRRRISIRRRAGERYTGGCHVAVLLVPSGAMTERAARWATAEHQPGPADGGADALMAPGLHQPDAGAKARGSQCRRQRRQRQGAFIARGVRRVPRRCWSRPMMVKPPA